MQFGNKRQIGQLSRMKGFNSSSFILFIFICIPIYSFAQDTSRLKLQENFKREIVFKDKRFRVYNNWFSGAGGLAANTANPYPQTVLAVNFNFHIHQYYFRLGGMMSGDDFGLWNNFQAHIAWIPYRKETEKFHLATMCGPSYCTGYDFIRAPDIYDNNNPYAAFGVYAEFQAIKKIYYDVGLGGAFFVNVNSKNSIVGIRVDVFLSSAFKGYVKGKEPLRNY